MSLLARALVSIPLALAVLLAPSPAAARTGHGDDPAAAPAAVMYRPPVDAPVSDPFRAPASPYGPGNRGIEFATGPGDVVAAAAPGVVTFAGSVAGRRYVTVRHADGLRTTYGPLATVASRVVAGTTVAAGQRVGVAGGPVLWTARLGAAAYVDPAVLLAASGTGRVRLVPTPTAMLVRRPDARRVDPENPDPGHPTVARPGACPAAVCERTDGKEGPWPPSSP